MSIKYCSRAQQQQTAERERLPLQSEEQSVSTEQQTAELEQQTVQNRTAAALKDH
jgi:hypothetical protein